MGHIYSKEKAEDNLRQDAEFHGGKTFDEWITQAKQGRRLEDREDALQVLRNHCLLHDRGKTLRAFTELLSDKAPTVRSLAATGLQKAGKPTDPKAAAKLIEIISQDLSGLKLPNKAGKVGAEFGAVVRAIGALEVIGETNHVPALKRVSENETVDWIIRQSAAKAIGQIEKRASEEWSDSIQQRPLAMRSALWEISVPSRFSSNCWTTEGSGGRQYRR